MATPSATRHGRLTVQTAMATVRAAAYRELRCAQPAGGVRGALVLAALSCPFVFGCERQADPAPSTSASTLSSGPALRAGPALRVAIVTPTAFALSSAPFGASASWVEQQGTRLALVTLDLNQEGAPERDAWTLWHFPEGVVAASDLATVWQGMNRAALWLEQGSGVSRVQALFKPEAADAEAHSLGAGYEADPSSRGNLALAAGQGDLTAFVRGPREPCLEDTGVPCYGFRFHRFGASSEPPTRLTLSVPVPCESIATQLLVTQPRWYYGVCTTQGAQTVTTMFTIQPSPEYAAARELFAGCEPRGALLVEGKPASVAECGGERRIAWLGSGDVEPRVEAFTPSAPICDGEPRVALGSQQLALSEPVERLELVLPETLVPAGALSVWSGRALLVARYVGGALELKRYACRGGELRDLGAAERFVAPQPSPSIQASSTLAPR